MWMASVGTMLAAAIGVTVGEEAVQRITFEDAKVDELPDGWSADTTGEGPGSVWKVVEGKRTQLASADVEAPAGQWHTIRIMHEGNRVRCFLNGKRYLDVRDDTFSQDGKIGLRTKADSVTHFDDLKVLAPCKRDG